MLSTVPRGMLNTSLERLGAVFEEVRRGLGHLAVALADDGRRACRTLVPLRRSSQRLRERVRVRA